MTLDEAVSEARKRVPVGNAADHPFCEVTIQIASGCANATISRDTFSQEPGVTDFYGSGSDGAEAIMAAVASYEASASHASDCALHNGPALPPGPCNCKS